MALYRMCGSCGKQIQIGTMCECQKKRYKEYDKRYRDKKAKAFYDSRAWQKTRDYVLSIDEMDVYIFMTTGKVVAADTVHHIYPWKDNFEKRLDISNLMSLHHDTHSMIEQKYKKDKRGMIELLTKMLYEFRQGRGYQ